MIRWKVCEALRRPKDKPGREKRWLIAFENGLVQGIDGRRIEKERQQVGLSVRRSVVT